MEIAHGNHFADHSRAASYWRSSNLALQLGMGLLPERVRGSRRYRVGRPAPRGIPVTAVKE